MGLLPEDWDDLSLSAMIMTRNESRRLCQAGFSCLARGDAAAARDSFSQVVQSGRTDADAFLGLALAGRALGDRAALGEAIERLLAVAPRHIQGLVLKADLLAGSGDERAASSFYLAAVEAAAAQPPLSPALAAEVERARVQCQRYAGEYAAHIRTQLANRGLTAANLSPRFAMSLDVLFGQKSIYVQSPRYFYFPGLPQIQFYERAQFQWLDTLEASTAEIREELAAVLRDATAFKPYVEAPPGRPHKPQDGMLDNPDWSAFYLWKNGQLVPDNAARCPKTVRALEAVPLAQMPRRSPSVLFSLLRPGARIPPHNGLVNTRLICHLPLIVPGQCGFRVGNETREWQPGRAWVFDDSIEHEAWNRSDQTRVILLFDIWRPELAEAEREQLCALFDAIDNYRGGEPAWEI
jgi:aspartate beta-hydroxylase